MNRIRLFSLLLFLPSLSCLGAETAAPDLPTRYETFHADYRINEDGSHVATYQTALKLLKERAIEQVKQRSISFSTSIQKAEVVAAYTRKADGRRINVPKDNFQTEENRGRDKASPVFSDYTTLTVVFPEVAVGDTVVLTYKMIQTEPIFPGQFSEVARFPRIHAYDDVVIRFDYPAALWVQYEAREMDQRTEERGGRKVVEWRYANPQPIKSERRNYSVYDMDADPGYSFSTFRSHEEIAEAYGLRARPKAAVSERIRKLADELTAGKNEPRGQAHALYDWVATHITYAGNCIGVGAVVPHDLDFVIDNRMGDCKDHATLLQALLAAKGIPSTQALVNAGNVYRLPRIPVVSMVNHVINYVPGLDLYLDSTAQAIPFGLLPMGVVGKPVLWVDGFKPGTAIPVPAIGENRQEMKTVAVIGEDGSMSGSTEIALNGLFAADTRAWMRRIPKDQEEELIKTAFQRQGYLGSGNFDKPDPTELRSSYHYTINFEVKGFVQRPGAGAFAIAPLVFSEAPISHFVSAAVEPVEAVEVFCASGRSSEEYEIKLPGNMKILALPDDLSIKNDFLSYQASYKLKGNTLTVKRVFDDRTRGHICSPALMTDYKEFAAKAMADTRAQVVYK